MIDRMVARFVERAQERWPAVVAGGHYLTLEDRPGPGGVWWLRLRNSAGRVVWSWGFGPIPGVGIRAVAGIAQAVTAERAALAIWRDLLTDDPRPLPHPL